MSTERIYLSDPFCFRFAARVTGTKPLGNGQLAVTLDRTCFYPTGGGQDHDTGTLNGTRVVDAYNDESGDIVHVVEGTLSGDAVEGEVDVHRRLAFMQHHSAQHLVSAVLDSLLGLETVSSHIGIDSPTTIDVPTTRIEDADLRQIEDEANAIVFEDWPINSFTVTEEQVPSLDFRRPPKVKGAIRVVEIEGIDISACGGTHCKRTGMIGTLKILRAERRGDETRVHLVAGRRALEYYQEYHSIVSTLARQLATNPEGIPDAVTRQAQLLHDTQKELGDLRQEKAGWEVKQLVADARDVGAVRLTIATFRDRAVNELRSLASELQHEPRLIAVLLSYDGSRISAALTCAADTGLNASALIRALLAEIGGKGGGDARLAQGGGAAGEEQFRAFVDAIPIRIQGLSAN